MRPIRTFAVVPSLPAALEPLLTIAYNLRWAWHHDSVELFRRLDDDVWQATGHNPVLMLGRLEPAQLEAAAADEGFRAHMERVSRDLRDYLESTSTWFARSHGAADQPLVAYFSAEFGVTECLTIFAGGLGVLAGDHLKSSSDLGVPLVGVGLLYQQGYFHQYLSEAGWQQEAYLDNDFHNLPLRRVRRPDGAALNVAVPLGGKEIMAGIWRADVGRVPLILLDTNLSENDPEDRAITDQLYGGDIETRIRQEIVLGIGGFRALEALGIEPRVYHMNEGHSAFLGLERVERIRRQYSAPFDVARHLASAGLVFTTHTPVPAGQDVFPPYLIDRYFCDYYARLGLDRSGFLGLGRQNPANEHEPFNMTVLALRMASYSNGVSQLHGEVTRRMWSGIWPDVPVDEVPIGHVTNGVHLRSWIARDIDQLYDRYLGPRWRDVPVDGDFWRRVDRIPAEEMWQSHERRRERLVAYARRKVRQQVARHAPSPSELEAASEVLHSSALTIGFSRRFATYKRATLLLRDPDRLARLLNDPSRPVQIIFAGKAHPRDDYGKELIRQIVTLAREEPFRRRIVFIEDYDMNTSSYLVQGADIWLNTPRRPMEASGTSGMKAAANGVINVSTLDGWWAEAWSMASAEREPIGWAVGRGEEYQDPAVQDEVEAHALYDLLEQEVIPTFYDRGPDGLPRRWIERMKASIRAVAPFFNTNRMVWDYAERFYLPAAERVERLEMDDLAVARDLARWEERVRAAWPRVRIQEVVSDVADELKSGGRIAASACVDLAGLTPEDVRVELYLGVVHPDGHITRPRIAPMSPARDEGDGRWLFQGAASPSKRSGLQGFTVRVLPAHRGLVTPFLPGLIRWASLEGD